MFTTLARFRHGELAAGRDVGDLGRERQTNRDGGRASATSGLKGNQTLIKGPFADSRATLQRCQRLIVQKIQFGAKMR